MVLRLPDSKEIRKLESRFIRLIERTFLKGALGSPGYQIKNDVRRAFQSKTFQLQLDQIINDIFRASVAYADKQIKRPPSVYASVKPYRGRPVLLAAGEDPYPITEELVRESSKLSAEAADSLVRFLQDEGLYTQHPTQLERRIRDLWGGSKYKATRFARTVTADIAVNTAVSRYQEMGIQNLQFYALIDEKTSPQCRTFHGTIIPAKSGDINRYRPPLHHHCRSCLLPVPGNYKIDDNLKIENRDFTRHYDQNFIEIPGIQTTIDQMEKTFEQIGTFNEKYRISQFILDADTEKRLLKLKLSVIGEPPISLPKTEKPGPSPSPEPVKVKEPVKKTYEKGSDVRARIPQVRADYEASIKSKTDLLNKYDKEKERLGSEYQKAMNEMARKFNNKVINPLDPEYIALDNKLTSISQELDKVDDLFSKTLSERTKLMMKADDVIREMLYINDGPARTNVFSFNAKTPKQSRVYQAGKVQDFINRAVAQDIRDNVPTVKIIERGNVRAHAPVTRQEIVIGTTDDETVLLHEWGHHVEYNNPEVYDSAKNMISRRTEGDKLERLRDVTGNKSYKRNEVCKKDKFFNPYVGKYYGENVPITEAVSMGMQYLYKNPEWLAKTDPETFDWIVDTIRGNYG